MKAGIPPDVFRRLRSISIDFDFHRNAKIGLWPVEQKDFSQSIRYVNCLLPIILTFYKFCIVFQSHSSGQKVTLGCQNGNRSNKKISMSGYFRRFDWHGESSRVRLADISGQRRLARSNSSGRPRRLGQKALENSRRLTGFASTAKLFIFLEQFAHPGRSARFPDARGDAAGQLLSGRPC